MQKRSSAPWGPLANSLTMGCYSQRGGSRSLPASMLAAGTAVRVALGLLRRAVQVLLHERLLVHPVAHVDRLLVVDRLLSVEVGGVRVVVVLRSAAHAVPLRVRAVLLPMLLLLPEPGGVILAGDGLGRVDGRVAGEALRGARHEGRSGHVECGGRLLHVQVVGHVQDVHRLKRAGAFFQFLGWWEMS